MSLDVALVSIAVARGTARSSLPSLLPPPPQPAPATVRPYERARGRENHANGDEGGICSMVSGFKLGRSSLGSRGLPCFVGCNGLCYFRLSHSRPTSDTLLTRSLSHMQLRSVSPCPGQCHASCYAKRDSFLNSYRGSPTLIPTSPVLVPFRKEVLHTIAPSGDAAGQWTCTVQIRSVQDSRTQADEEAP